jgi:hypothetical protein
MDKEQAKFILRSFRPDDGAGNDTNSQDFAEALALAASNRELGEWLAKERAMDEAFAKALGTIELPGSLREDILGCLEGERRDYPNAEDKDDAAMIGALASMPLPANLRGDILAAMERSVPRDEAEAQTLEPATTIPLRKRLAIPLAAAAGIALALILTQGPGDGDPQVRILSTPSTVPIGAVPVSFIQTYEAPDFALEVKLDKREALEEVLHARKLPCTCSLPPSLEHTKSIGCRELVIDGKHGSLICFQEDEMGVIHLVIFKREDVHGSCSDNMAKPCLLKEGKWAIARWHNDESVFFLIGEGTIEQMKKLF